MINVAASFIADISNQDIDPIENTISIEFSSEQKVLGSENPPLGGNSPYFRHLDDYYNQLCARIFPNRWDGFHMFAEIDPDCLTFPFESGETQLFFFKTKWIIPEVMLEEFFSAIEDIDLLEQCSLTIDGIGGVTGGAPEPGETRESKVRTALFPLNLEEAKQYPFNFQRQSLGRPVMRKLSDLGLAA